MQVQCATKTQHQAMEVRRDGRRDEAAVEEEEEESAVQRGAARGCHIKLRHQVS